MNTATKSSFRERVRLKSKHSAADCIRLGLEQTGMSNVDFAERLGYPRPNVIAMIKNGEMRLPHSKVLPAAKALGLDPVFLMRKVMMESDAELWGSIEAIIGPSMMSADEVQLLTFVRERAEGFDIKFAEDDLFLDELAQLIEKKVEREKNLLQGTKDRIERERLARVAARG